MIKERLEEVFTNMKKYGKEEHITLVGVTKFVEDQLVKEAKAAGLLHVGENQVQEILRKKELFKDFHVHMIGRLQTNKVRQLTQGVNLIQSLDRMSLLKEMERIGKREDHIFHALIQVNVSAEEQKGGMAPTDISAFLDAVEEMSHVKIKGLMNVAPFAEDPETVRPVFRKMRELFEKYAKIGYNNSEMVYLSMGMSHDYTIALEEGANMIRVGSAIFGKRNY